jgi:hypothetical protein
MSRTPRWVVAGLLGMLTAALTSGPQPWFDALGGAFIPADIAQDSAAVRLFIRGISPYGPAIREAHAALLGVPVDGTFPHFPHPPFSLIVSLPLAFGPFEVSAILWFAFSLATVFLLAVLLESALRREGEPRVLATWQLAGLLLLWPPVLYNLEKGQWSLLLTLLLCLAWRANRRSDLRASAAWAAAAAAVKVYPAVLGLYFLVRSRWALAWFIAVGAVLTLVPIAWIGPAAIPAFIGESRMNMPYWESFPSVTFSIHGALARLLRGGQWAQPLVNAPTLALVLEVFTVGILLTLAMWLTRKADTGEADGDLALAAWLILLPALNPQSLGHNGALLALPILLLGRAIWRRGADGRWFGWGWATAVALVSIPKQTVWRVAPPPIDPAEGLLLVALPTWGTLLLFGLAVKLSTATGAKCPTDERCKTLVL